MQAQGAYGRLRIVDETTWGQTPTITAGTMKDIPILSAGLAYGQELRELRTLSGSRTQRKPRRGRVTADGEVAVALDPLAHGWLLKHLLGAPTTSGTGPYTHVFKVGGTLPAGMSAEVGYTDVGLYEVFRGLKVASATFRVPPAGEIETSLRLMGLTSSTGTSPLDSSPTTYAHDPFDGADAGNTLQEGGADIASLIDLEFTVDLQMRDVYTLANQGRRGAITPGQTRVSGRLTALFEDWTLVDKARNATETSLKVVLSRGDGLGSLNNESLEVLMPEVALAPTSPGIESPEGIEVSFEFQAYYDDAAEATSLQMTLKNSVAAYT